jgi:hypothetical protein
MLVLDAHLGVMKRPKRLHAPAYLSPSPPVPRADAGTTTPVPPTGEEERLDPTRYGDWEKKGVAIDF